MAKFLNRQVGKFRKRIADEADVGLLISETEYLQNFLDAVIDCTANYRKAWSEILNHQINIATAYLELYAPIPGSSQPTVDTPDDAFERLEFFREQETKLKDELQQDIQFLDTMILAPLTECKAALKGLHKTIKKRENKKLDYEKCAKHVEIYQKKTNRSSREDSILAKGEMDLDKAKTAFTIMDERLRDIIPPMLEKFNVILPLMLDTLFTCQNTFAAQAYTTTQDTASAFGITLESEIVADWEEVFKPVQNQLEQNLATIRMGNAVRQPMSQITKDTGIMSKFKPAGNRKAPPPPPPQPPKSRPGLGSRTSSNLTLRTNASARRSPSPSPSPAPPPPPSIPSNRPPIKSTVSASASEGTYSARQAGQRPGPASSNSDSAWLQPAGVAVEAATRPSRRSPSPSPTPSVAAKKKPPPPPPPKKKLPPPVPPQQEFLTALYDFTAQNAGDITFNAGDRILVTKKTGNLEDWWEGVVVDDKGRRVGNVGSFPRNYMQ